MKNRKKLSENIFEKKNFGVEKSKVANRPKRALPKFRGDRSEVRGVNGRSKFVAASAGRAERKQCAGVPPPAWLDPAFLEVWAEGPTERGSHVPPRAIDGHRRPSNFFILGAKLAPSSHFFAICLHFFRTMLRSCVFYRFPMVFEWILGGLGKVLGVFWRWFFTRFSKNSIF